MATWEYRSHIDASREHAQTFETISDEDAALLIRFSNRPDLFQGQIGDYR